MILLRVFALHALLVVGCHATDYCSEKLCPIGLKHIGCNNQNKFASNCDTPNLIKFGERLQKLLLDAYDEYRNRKAENNYTPAVWDEELAKLAEYNVRKCETISDNCTNTESHLYVDQNLASWQTVKPVTAETMEFFITPIQDRWFVSDQEMTDKPDNADLNFLKNEISTYIGCCASTFKIQENPNDGYMVLITCNYSYKYK